MRFLRSRENTEKITNCKEKKQFKQAFSHLIQKPADFLYRLILHTIKMAFGTGIESYFTARTAR
jgi:hypothetical protein